MTIWSLRSGMDRRFRSGHPWVYSNELSSSPKGLEPGAPVELRDAGGKFLARGFGNPSSLIAFRAVSRDPNEAEPLSDEGVLKRLLDAAQVREQLGLGEVSYRLCFGESDQLPGLVIDRYRTYSPDAQIYVVQAHAAGVDRLIPRMMSILEKLAAKTQGPGWDKTAIVIRNDIAVRKLEGLQEEEPRVLKPVAGLDLANIKIAVAAAYGNPVDRVEYSVDLSEGQKTGFFLDQANNIQLAASRLVRAAKAQGPKKIRILDLCCYVGQWSTQLARAYKMAGFEVEVTCVDVSARALELAKRNVENQGAKVTAIKADVLKDLGQIEAQSFDVIISDPPALIKGRKDIPQGTHAYLQLNTQVFRIIKRGGAVICCSCSALLEEEEFLKALSKAAYRNQAGVRWIARGGQAVDHPVRIEFPEGRYLKAWIGIVEE